MHAELVPQSDTICIICYDNEETEWISLACNHLYHKKCIQAWIQIRTNCPICTRRIERELLVEHGMQEHIAHPEVEDEQIVLDEQAQRNLATFLWMMLLIALTSFLIGLGLIM